MKFNYDQIEDAQPEQIWRWTNGEGWELWKLIKQRQGGTLLWEAEFIDGTTEWDVNTGDRHVVSLFRPREEDQGPTYWRWLLEREPFWYETQI